VDTAHSTAISSAEARCVESPLRAAKEHNFSTLVLSSPLGWPAVGLLLGDVATLAEDGSASAHLPQHECLRRGMQLPKLSAPTCLGRICCDCVCNTCYAGCAAACGPQESQSTVSADTRSNSGERQLGHIV
jgi:hypothetical protein